MSPASRSPEALCDWLEQEPPLEALQESFPNEWARVARELSAVTPRGPQALAAYVQSTTVPATSRRERRTRRDRDALVVAEVRHRMAVLAARSLTLSAATGVSEGHVRFNRLNGSIAQRLFFKQGLERKPVSMRWFTLVWPRLPQRNYLMPLVARRGIYCFYSRPLISRLASLIGGRRTLEIAAGDGTLTRFLEDAGAGITATDDHSWSDVTFPDWVLEEDASTSLRHGQPEAVVCSWPPADNKFETEVFRTPSVELYVVIGSRHRFAAGDWKAYESQGGFDMRVDEDLSRLVLPPDIEPAVYTFTRR